MSRVRKSILIILTALLCLTIFRSASAQTKAISAEQFEINIWPEYDRPSILVRYNIQLSPDVALPAQISLRIPVEAAPPYKIVYFLENSDRPYLLDFRTYTEDRWSRVIFTTSSPTITFEYYDTRLDTSSARRAYVFEWPGDITADSMTLSVQQPATASEMRLSERFSDGDLHADGLYYYTADLGQIDAGSTYAIAIRYIKDNTRPSFPRLDVEPVAPVNRETIGRFNLFKILPGITIGLIVLIILAAIMIIILRRYSNASRPIFEIDGAGKDSPLPVNSSSNAVFCPVCGNRAATGDNFCRVCGSRLNA